MKRYLTLGDGTFVLSRWPDDYQSSYGTGYMPGDPAEEEERDDGDMGAAPLASTSNWFKLQVLDDDTGKPIAGVPLTLKLPDGTKKKVETNAKGKVQLNDLPAGTVDILSMDDEEAFEVVDVS